MLAAVNNFFIWWMDGLRYLLPSGSGSGKRALAAHLYVEAGTQGLTLELRDDAGNVTDHREIGNDKRPDDDAVRRWLAPHLENSLPVLLRLPSEQALTPSLKLPRAAEKDLREVLRFELERQTPFSTDQVYFNYYSAHRETDAEKMQITLVVIRRTIVDALLERLHLLGITPTYIDTAGATYQDHGINLNPPGEAPPRSVNSLGLRVALYSLVVLLAIALVMVPVARTGAAIKELRAELADRKSEVKEIEALKRQLKQRRMEANFFIDLDNRRVRAIELLAEVTRVLPDDSWLHRFELDGSKGQFRGESGNASGLIPLFETSAYFRDVQFGSPVTRNNATGKDRFFLTAQISEKR